MGWAAGRCRGLGPRWALPSQSATRLSAVTTFVYAPVLENSPWPLQISAVNYRPTIIERAFILAASGRVGSVDEIRQALKNEGYVEGGQLYGPTISKQLSKLIFVAKAKAEAQQTR